MVVSRFKSRIAVCAIAVVALLIAGCSSSSSSGGSSSGSYNIGMSMDLSGPLAFNGQPASAGFEASIDRINAAGGVNGKKIKLQVLDDASDIAKGRANLLEFVSKHDLASFGYILSDVSAALLPLATKEKIPLVGLGGPDSSFVPLQPYFFSYQLRTSRIATAELNYIATAAKAAKIAHPRIAIIAANVASAYSVAALAKTEIQSLGWTLATVQYVPVTATNVSVQAAAIKAAKPNYVMLDHNDAGAEIIVPGLRSQGVDVPVIGPSESATNTAFKALGNGFVAFRTYADPSQTDIPAVKAMVDNSFAQQYKKEMINYYFTQGWVAGEILQKALEKCGSNCSSGQQLARAFESVGTFNTNGLSSGPLELTAASHEWVHDVIFYKWDSSTDKVVPASGVVSAMQVIQP